MRLIVKMGDLMLIEKYNKELWSLSTLTFMIFVSVLLLTQIMQILVSEFPTYCNKNSTQYNETKCNALVINVTNYADNNMCYVKVN